MIISGVATDGNEGRSRCDSDPMQGPTSARWFACGGQQGAGFRAISQPPASRGLRYCGPGPPASGFGKMRTPDTSAAALDPANAQRSRASPAPAPLSTRGSPARNRGIAALFAPRSWDPRVEGGAGAGEARDRWAWAGSRAAAEVSGVRIFPNPLAGG